MKKINRLNLTLFLLLFWSQSSLANPERPFLQRCADTIKSFLFFKKNPPQAPTSSPLPAQVNPPPLVTTHIEANHPIAEVKMEEAPRMQEAPTAQKNPLQDIAPVPENTIVKVNTPVAPQANEKGGLIQGMLKHFITPSSRTHASFQGVVDQLEELKVPASRYRHLPDLEQKVKFFKDTNVPYIEYFYFNGARMSAGMKEFLENTIEIIYTPHASTFGHIRYRIGTKLYGFENVKSTFMAPFDSTVLFKEVRAVKKVPGRDPKKEGNLGFVFTLTEEQKSFLAANREKIDKLYTSSQAYNIPPFDGSGAKEVQVVVDEQTGKLRYHSPTSKSAYGNRAEITGEIVTVDDKEYLKSPSGYMHPIFLNQKGKKVVNAYSCTSSVHLVLSQMLGFDIKDMPYAGSFVTHLKNGGSGHLSPDAIIHYYPSSDL